MNFEEKVPRKGQKILMRAAVIVGAIVLGGAWIYLDSGKVEETPTMVKFLRKYAGWKIDKISQQKTKKDGYTTLDTYYDMKGKYRFHYICTNRPGLKINDNRAGCKYKFDGGEETWDFYRYFNEMNWAKVGELAEKYAGIEISGMADMKVKNQAELKEFFWEFLELPEMADFYKVCWERKRAKDYFEFEGSCNENMLRINARLSGANPDPGETIFEWGVKNNMELKR